MRTCSGSFRKTMLRIEIIAKEGRNYDKSFTRKTI